MSQNQKTQKIELEKILSLEKKLITLEKLMVRCPECGGLFRDVIELKSHMTMTHHPSNEENSTGTG